MLLSLAGRQVRGLDEQNEFAIARSFSFGDLAGLAMLETRCCRHSPSSSHHRDDAIIHRHPATVMTPSSASSSPPPSSSPSASPHHHIRATGRTLQLPPEMGGMSRPWVDHRIQAALDRNPLPVSAWPGSALEAELVQVCRLQRAAAPLTLGERGRAYSVHDNTVGIVSCCDHVATRQLRGFVDVLRTNESRSILGAERGC
jgi:hypothetical protein